MSFYAMLSAFAFPVSSHAKTVPQMKVSDPVKTPFALISVPTLGKDRRILLEKIMKNLLATTTIAMVALTGAASAQSVLERVLGQIDNATNLASVNGTFANIAENIGGSAAVTVYSSVSAGGAIEVLSEAEYDAITAGIEDVRAAALLAAGDVPLRSDYSDDTTGQTSFDTAVSARESAISTANGTATTALTAHTLAYKSETIAVSGIEGINGSISNVVDGIDAATQTAVVNAVSAVEFNMPTLDFADMATTALGAVNTGDITLGVNSAVDEAKTTSTQAVSSVMNQLGGSADTGAIVLNIASNMTGINGSITNAMTEVNGTIGSLSTTALGAVNTGVIISGVDSAVQGIIGMSGSVN